MVMFFSYYISKFLVEARTKNCAKQKQLYVLPSECPIIGLKVPVSYMSTDFVVSYSV